MQKYFSFIVEVESLNLDNSILTFSAFLIILFNDLIIILSFLFLKLIFLNLSSFLISPFTYLIILLLKSSLPKCSSPKEAKTLYSFPLILTIETSKVPPPKSNINTFLSILDLIIFP